MTACDAESLLVLAKCYRCVDPGYLPDMALGAICDAPPPEGIMLGNPETEVVLGDPGAGFAFGIP